MKKLIPQINKKIIIGILIMAVLIFAGILGFAIFQKKKIPLGKEVIPEKEEKIEGILEKLTPKETKPLTQEEKEELEKTLKELTPINSKPMTEKEKKELEELLKQLTP